MAKANSLLVVLSSGNGSFSGGSGHSEILVMQAVTHSSINEMGDAEQREYAAIGYRSLMADDRVELSFTLRTVI